jgi:hypothetical protein
VTLSAAVAEVLADEDGDGLDVEVVFVALAEAVDPGCGHVCSGQVTTGLRVTLPPGLAAWRIRATASAAARTVGKITAQK